MQTFRRFGGFDHFIYKTRKHLDKCYTTQAVISINHVSVYKLLMYKINFDPVQL